MSVKRCPEKHMEIGNDTKHVITKNSRHDNRCHGNDWPATAPAAERAAVSAGPPPSVDAPSSWGRA